MYISKLFAAIYYPPGDGTNIPDRIAIRKHNSPEKLQVSTSNASSWREGTALW